MAKSVSGGRVHWTVELKSGRSIIEFQHGTTSGSRVIIVNGTEVVRHVCFQGGASDFAGVDVQAGGLGALYL